LGLQQTKEIKKRFFKELISKQDLAKKLNTNVSKINEYILGDDEPPHNVKIIPDKNKMVIAEFSEEVEVPKYEGVFFNELKSGDRTYYITYKDIATNKKIYLKIGKKSQGITEPYCVNKRNEVLNQIRAGETPTQVKNKRVVKLIKTFDMIAEEYHKDKITDMTNRNLKYSKSLYLNHIQPYLGNMDIEKIKTEDIDNITLDKIDSLSANTLKGITEKISSIFNFSIKKGLFKSSNPAINAKKIKTENERTRFLSLEEIKKLIESVKDNDVLYLFTILSLSTGGRLKTICNIKVKDIDFNTMFIELRDFKNKTSYKGFLKNDIQFLEVLKKQIKDKDPMQFILGRDTLIANVRYIERNIPKILNELFNQHINEDRENLTAEQLAENRREKVVIHTLRHTFASQLAIHGTPIYTIKERMNHKDISQTMRYAKLAPDSGRSDVDGLF